MLPMFFGTVKRNGEIDPNYARSGNFTTARGKKDEYTIQLDEWIALRPTVAITGMDDGNTARYPAYEIAQSNNDQYTIKVTMHDHAKGDGLDPFSFVAMVGSTLVNQVAGKHPKFVLTSEILKFGANQTKTLVVKTQIDNITYYLDRGTVLFANVDRDAEDITFQGGHIQGYEVNWYINETKSIQPWKTWTSDGVSNCIIKPPPVGTRTALNGLTCVATKDGHVLSADPIVIVQTMGSTSA